MSRYTNFIAGLSALNDFDPLVNFDNIPRSFPNGAPDHSHSSYCVVEVNADKIWNYIHNINKDFVLNMKELGWRSENEDCYWIFQ